MKLKDIILNATTYIHICNGIRKQNVDSAYNLRISLIICGYHLQFADFTYNLRMPLKVADSATAQFNDTNVLLFVCGFHKIAYFWSDFEQNSVISICLWSP